MAAPTACAVQLGGLAAAGGPPLGRRLGGGMAQVRARGWCCGQEVMDSQQKVWGEKSAHAANPWQAASTPSCHSKAQQPCPAVPC